MSSWSSIVKFICYGFGNIIVECVVSHRTQKYSWVIFLDPPSLK